MNSPYQGIHEIIQEVSLMANLYKPGTDNRQPGHYTEVGPRGGNVPNGHDASIQGGDRLPPTSKPGNRWRKG